MSRRTRTGLIIIEKTPIDKGISVEVKKTRSGKVLESFLIENGNDYELYNGKLKIKYGFGL